MPNTEYKIKGIIGTILLHALLVFLLFIFGFSTPLPLPAEKGILINFGNSENGSGFEEPKIQESYNPPKQEMSSRPQDESPMTQTHEEAPSLPNVKKESTKKENTKSKTETTNNNSTSETKKEETNTEKQPKINKKALFPGQINTGSNTGEGETGVKGNQGSLEGSSESTNRTGSDGGGGNADNGIIANLNGRVALRLPKPEYPSLKSGKVVVEVTVDNQGRVVKAVAGVKGSTTLDNQLLRAAEKAALNARFDVAPNAPASQIGTITYIFKLQ
ncbi:energy transducer TonB family protein [Tenuifilum thalassicum]|uniref:TonB family protein n=1 Tax=Tenuifilum thalassicum TaxID=2590900 RepID=A0A7D3XDV2_9BACT|nr:energy transducer TonB [Tenuifilum thalassicum]QKG79407.1 TonB family protein [Tenuifilum thalassicum]